MWVSGAMGPIAGINDGMELKEGTAALRVAIQVRP